MDDGIEQALRHYRLWERFERENPNSTQEWKKFQIDLPTGFLDLLDEECDRRGVPRQSLIKFIVYEWLTKCLEQRASLWPRKKRPLSTI
jgi:hypothetical protein